jgi:hypothetical protein
LKTGKGTKGFTGGDNMIIDENLLSYWGEDAFTEPSQLKRLNSAKSAKLTPVEIDTENICCIFQGSAKKPYQTTIDSCECRDWFVHHRPCKHMYRTAIEFKYIDGLDAENNIEVVKEQAAINNGYSLSDAIDIIEQLNPKYQIMVQEHLCNISKENIPFCAEKNQKYDYLIEKGIFERVYDMPKILNSYSMKEINERLAPLELKYNKNMKTEDIVEYCLQNVDEHKLQQLFSEKYLLRFNPMFIKSHTLLYRYFYRKYGTQFVYDENKGNFYTVSRLDTELPNDRATQELIKRGYYSREDVNYY